MLTYHTKRYRDTCIGSGHTHCSGCDMSLSMGRREYGDHKNDQQDMGKEPRILCTRCWSRERQGR